jgi:predicted short-subunit dehydrogenase-like oxidoreductase (DUF2520 family)
MRSPEAVAVVGAGRMAQALGRLLVRAGRPVVALAGRHPERTRAAAAFVGAPPAALADAPRLASRLLIAVSDDALTQVARTLAEAGMSDGAALHTSGAHGPEALAPLAQAGVCCGALHPLQTVPDPERGAAALEGAFFGVTAEGPAEAWALEIVQAARGVPLRIPAERRPLYHAAAVLAGNCLVGLVDAAVMLMSTAGVEQASALRALAPLVRTSAENALALGPERALTGPVERGDWRTLERHWKALAEAPPSVRELYRACTRQLIALAARRGTAEAGLRRLEQLFE